MRVHRLSDRPLRGPSVLRAEIHLAGRTARVMSVTADVRFFRRVLVAGRNIRRGDELNLVLDGGNMRLMARATALQAGGVGQRIRVRNADSGKVLQGWVADARTVEIR